MKSSLTYKFPTVTLIFKVNVCQSKRTSRSFVKSQIWNSAMLHTDRGVKAPALVLYWAIMQHRRLGGAWWSKWHGQRSDFSQECVHGQIVEARSHGDGQGLVATRCDRQGIEVVDSCTAIDRTRAGPSVHQTESEMIRLVLALGKVLDEIRSVLGKYQEPTASIAAQHELFQSRQHVYMACGSRVYGLTCRRKKREMSSL